MERKPIIITGPVHSGKSTTLLEYCTQNAERFNLGGIINPRIRGEKVFIELPSFEDFPMNGTPNEPIVAIGKYLFSQTSFERANKAILKAIDARSNCIVVDEIGPLELSGQGLAQGIEAALRYWQDHRNVRLIFTVRKRLVEQVQSHFNLHQAEIRTKYDMGAARPILLWLAGGQSSRMGIPKHQLVYDGNSALELATRQFSANTPNPFRFVVSCKTQDTASFTPYETCGDRYENIGPMGGIVSAMESSDAGHFVVLGCDLPFVKEAHLQQLLEAHDFDVAATCAIKRGSDFPEPLVSVWNRSALPGLKTAIESGDYSLVRFLKSQRINTVEMDTEILMNVNTPTEYDAAKAQSATRSRQSQ